MNMTQKKNGNNIEIKGQTEEFGEESIVTSVF